LLKEYTSWDKLVNHILIISGIIRTILKKILKYKVISFLKRNDLMDLLGRMPNKI
jgi:hypothetical protein